MRVGDADHLVQLGVAELAAGELPASEIFTTSPGSGTWISYPWEYEICATTARSPSPAVRTTGPADAAAGRAASGSGALARSRPRRARTAPQLPQ
ncbi:hypothetical protein [Nocardia sp. R6R-6]|uniref:hypothetical protein n=1 Tax=Nocardia sp. R6R-6 TaxID=3459303 RepID=UPI00403DA238